MITSQKGRKRANVELAFVERQIADLRREREAALAGFERAEEFLQADAFAIRENIRDYDERNAKPSPQQKLEVVS
jgi:hypothetical protein